MISKYTPLCQTASINNINKELATPPPPKKLRNQFKHISNSKVMPMIIDISSLISFLTPSKSGNTNWKNFSFSDFDPTSKVFLLKVGKKFATRYPLPQPQQFRVNPPPVVPTCVCTMLWSKAFGSAMSKSCNPQPGSRWLMDWLGFVPFVSGLQLQTSRCIFWKV